MATHNQDSAISSTCQIDDSDDTQNLSSQGTTAVGYIINEVLNVSEAADKTGNVINIKGEVRANGPLGAAAVNIAGQKTEVHLLENPKLPSDTDIISTSPGAIILNEG
jgi:hypothetical protein